jgi:hypothetical protein
MKIILTITISSPNTSKFKMFRLIAYITSPNYINRKATITKR